MQHAFSRQTPVRPSFTNRIRGRWQADKSIWIYIITLVIISRVFLSILGVFILKEYPLQRLDFGDLKAALVIQQPVASVWFVYDSYWYLKIAKEGYVDSMPLSLEHPSTMGFFPLYPALMSVICHVVGDYFWSGIIVSNIFLVIGAFLLYKLIRLDADETTAKRGVLFLLLLPAGFILSGVYPMSLLFCMWVASVLAARLNHFAVAGLCGMVAMLSHPIGGFIIIPIFLIYLWNKKFAWRKIRLDILYLGLIPLGVALFCLENYIITGDWLAYFHVQTALYGHQHFTNPLSIIGKYLWGNPHFMINDYFIITMCVLLFFNYRRLFFPYWFFAVFMLLFTPVTNTVLGSIRYSCALFPIAVLFSQFPANKVVTSTLVVFLGLLQTALFIFWTLQFPFMS